MNQNNRKKVFKKLLQVSLLLAVAFISRSVLNAKNSSYEKYSLKVCNSTYCYLLKAENAQSSHLSPETVYLYDVSLKIFFKTKITISDHPIRDFKALSAYVVDAIVVMQDVDGLSAPDFSLFFDDGEISMY
ncbi:MAG: hypothetical protein HOO06_00095 [Bdellovibrionaceae bacterium]|nr:hypothetical protein [Pseudobdellovibrionaceae bacterium]